MEFNPLFFERVINSFVLLLSLFLFLSILHVEDMDKREFCYDYVISAQCVCNSDVDQLLNTSVKIANVKDLHRFVIENREKIKKERS